VAEVPVAAVTLTLADGTKLRHEWSTEDVANGAMPSKPPDWMINPSKRWDSPEEPVELWAGVKEGFEKEALEWIARL
jgi:hypothetical protein